MIKVIIALMFLVATLDVVYLTIMRGVEETSRLMEARQFKKALFIWSGLIAGWMLIGYIWGLIIIW